MVGGGFPRREREREMRLSEAIRLGAMLKPQTRIGKFYMNGASCALGAAADAAGVTLGHDYDYGRLYATWPWLHREVAPPMPEMCAGAVDVLECVWMLNDNHRWTREQIADWVATIEPEAAQPETAVEPAEACVAVARTQNVP